MPEAKGLGLKEQSAPRALTLRALQRPLLSKPGDLSPGDAEAPDCFRQQVQTAEALASGRQRGARELLQWSYPPKLTLYSESIPPGTLPRSVIEYAHPTQGGDAWIVCESFCR